MWSTYRDSRLHQPNSRTIFSRRHRRSWVIILRSRSNMFSWFTAFRWLLNYDTLAALPPQNAWFSLSKWALNSQTEIPIHTPPQKPTRNLNIWISSHWKRNQLFEKWSIFEFHLSFPQGRKYDFNSPKTRPQKKLNALPGRLALTTKWSWSAFFAFKLGRFGWWTKRFSYRSMDGWFFYGIN